MHENLKFTLITVIRNEQDILNTFLNHIDALFDEVYLVDHRSVDQTGNILQSSVTNHKNWHYITFEANALYQKEITTLLMHTAFGKDADCVFFLDCDEFIQVSSRDELQQIAIGLYDSATAGGLPWKNCIVDNLNKGQFTYESSIWMNPEPSHFSKICVPSTLYNKYSGRLSITQGNHQVLDSENNVLDTIDIGYLLHIPIRSRYQFIKKSLQSSLGNIARTTRKPGESYQFFEMLKMIKSGTISDDIIRGCISLYQKELSIIPISKKQIKIQRYIKTSLRNLGIHSTHKISSPLGPKDPYIVERILSDQILSWESENPQLLAYDEKKGEIFIERPEL
jgi:hypothetical protein